MKRWGLFLLRVTTGWLLVMWGIDKLVDVGHGQRVAEAFYLGIGSQAVVQNVFGVLQIILGALVVLGLWRKRAYPVAFVILMVTALGVWRSIIDPWGWFLDGATGALLPIGDHRGGGASSLGHDRRGPDDAGCEVGGGWIAPRAHAGIDIMIR